MNNTRQGYSMLNNTHDAFECFGQSLEGWRRAAYREGN